MVEIFLYRLFDIGLHQQGKSELLLELLIPTIFSIVIVIQLHFFHKPLTMHITRLLRYRKSKQRQERRNRIDGGGAGAGDTNTVSTDVTTSMASNVTASSLGSASDESDDEPEYTIMVKLRKAYFQMTVVLWRLAEINSPKLVSLVVMLVAVQQVKLISGTEASIFVAKLQIEILFAIITICLGNIYTDHTNNTTSRNRKEFYSSGYGKFLFFEIYNISLFTK